MVLPDGELLSTTWMSYILLVAALFTVLALQFYDSPYGRYASRTFGFPVNVKLAWFIQELPAFVVPIWIILFTDTPALYDNTNKILLAMYLLHYLQRAFIYPALIRGGKDTPVVPFILACIFCLYNGYLQGSSLSRENRYSRGWKNDPRFIIGTGLFFIGMAINLHSDHILRNLRNPAETTYKIPKGGVFELVSAANLFGECLEWFGFSLACWSLPSFAFFTFVLSNLLPRACAHHRWYLEKFKEEYPKNRKALIPFLL